MKILTLIPAYGRDYKSIAEVREAWASGADFCNGSEGGYTNSLDAKALREAGYTALEIRFKCLSRVAVIKL